MIADPKERKQARDVFLQWDNDKDGMLTDNEIEEHMAEICSHFGLKQPDVQKMIRALDPNSDGQIEYN